MQKHLEEQLEEMLRLFDENNSDEYKKSENFNDDFFKLKPGFKKHIEEFHSSVKSQDSDLDGKAYAEQLKTLLDRIAPEKRQQMQHQQQTQQQQQLQLQLPHVKRSEEEQIMDKIHGTVQEQAVVSRPKPNRRSVSPGVPPNGVFDGNSPRVFGQSIISQTIRKPDGSYETKRTIRDSTGQTKTTIIKSENGHTQEITTYSDDKNESLFKDPFSNENKNRINPELESTEKPLVILDRTMYLDKSGYTMPRNLF